MTTAACQGWNAERYVRNAGFVADLGAPLSAPRAGELILDLGCDDGALSVRIEESGARVIAVDASTDMVAAGFDARVMNGEALRPRLCNAEERGSPDYVRLRTVAHLPGNP